MRTLCALLLWAALVIAACRQPPPPTKPLPTPTSVATAQPLIAEHKPLPTMTATASSTPVPDRLEITVEAPPIVAPGTTFNLLLRLTNPTGRDVRDIQVVQPIPDALELLQLPEGAVLEEERLIWTIDVVRADAAVTAAVFVQAPNEPVQLRLPAASVDAGELRTARSQPLFIEVGGVFPIIVARQLDGEEVSVNGRVTLVVEDAYYLEDSSGAIRIEAAQDAVAVNVGDVLLVEGQVSSNQGQPFLIAQQVSPSSTAPVLRQPVSVALQQFLTSTVPGETFAISGTLRQVDVRRDATLLSVGNDSATVIAHLPPPIAAVADQLTLDNTYRISGIAETVDGARRLLVRQATDIAPVYPAALRVALDVPLTTNLNQPVTHTIRIHNDTEAAVERLIVAVPVPAVADGAQVALVDNISSGGNLGSDDIIYWGIPPLGKGISTTLSFRAAYSTPGVATTAIDVRPSLPLPVTGEFTIQIYAGQNVPIAAIQGEQNRSPLIGKRVRTEGIVTAVAEQLDGFFIQSTSTDGSPVALFVRSNDQQQAVRAGDYVVAEGTVREPAGLTTLLTHDGAIDMIGRDNQLPLPLPYVPPAQTQQYDEALEGVLVMLTESALVVALDDSGEALLQYISQVGTAEAATIVVSSPQPPAVGARVAPFTGILIEQYGRYSIIPLSEITTEP